MALTRLDITNFRNITAIKLEPGCGFNLIFGQNGSGKTSIIESIYYLGFGRSFRSLMHEHLIQRSKEKFSIYANLNLSDKHQVPLGLERSKQGSLRMKREGQEVASVVDLAQLLPIQLINSHCYNLLDAGPLFRRKYLDWGVFYLNPEFLSLWRHFKRIIKQRNAALQRFVSQKEVSAWNQELIVYAERVNQARLDYLNELLPRLNAMIHQLLPLFNANSTLLGELEVTYYSGWKQTVDYSSVLEESLSRDLQLGYTQFGPHRADLKVTLNRQSAKDILSRGQQKLFVCAMILAQGELLHNKLNKRPIYLVDDLPSELDSTSRSTLITLLSKQQAQVFVTAVDGDLFEKHEIDKPVKLFHVEHGNLVSGMR